MSARNNYEKYEEAKCDLTIGDIVNAFDFIQALMGFVPEDDKLRKVYEHVIKPLDEFVARCLTEEKCPHCGRALFYSDVDNYDYLCTECNERFNESEVK